MTDPQILGLPVGYAEWLTLIKVQITQARQRATFAVNAELVSLYGRIGREILLRQTEQGWGAKVIDRLAHDLKDAFPDMRGWSSSNLKYMRFFAQHCPEGLIGQQPADQLPWFHIVTLLTKLNFYLTAVDAQIKATDDKPTIGLLLCKKQNRLVAQYALSGIDKPIGVAEYQLLRELPETLVSNLPSIAEIEAELGGEMGGIDEE